MTTAETHATDKAAAVAAQGTHDAPEKPPSKAANGTKQGAQAKATAPKKAAKAGGKSSKKAGNRERKAASPRAESKGAKILEMIARAKGATLAEIMKAWQAHSVRGFISTAGKKHGVKIEVGDERCR
jgi:hypothetical protein